jgi:HK97 family phage major capsid protein
MSELHKIARISVKSATPENEKWMRVITTAPTLDRDGEVIDTASLRVPIKPKGWKYASDLLPGDKVDLPFLLDHKWEVEKQLGSVRSMFINADGELETLVGFTSLARGKDAHVLAKEGHLGNSFSGTFDYSNGYLVDGVIFDAEIVELSMVFKGSNRDARVLEVSKSVKKGTDMAEAKSIAELEKELEEAKAAKSAEAEVETPEVEAPAETVETTVEEKAIKKEKKEDKMSEKSVAVKQVKDVPEVAPVVAKKTVKVTKDEQRALFVKQFVAMQSHDYTTLADLNEKAYQADSSEYKELKKKAIDFADGASIFQTEVVSSDIQQEYTNVGRVGQLVDRIDISGAETWKQIIQTAGSGFQPVGAEEVKQEDKPVWTHLSIEPKEHALIVAWYDGMAKRTPLAVYQSLVTYIAREYAKLEDKIIISFAGVTTGGGDVFAPTGLFPILQTAGRIVNVADLTAAKIQDGLGRAYGDIESDGELTLITNRATWGAVAVTVDTTGRNVFTQVGDQVSAGALGSFRVVLSQYVPNGVMIMGVMSDYQLVTNGGLETLFSREATVGSLNLFTSDASALRAACDISGKPVRNTSFVLIDFVPQIS